MSGLSKGEQEFVAVFGDSAATILSSRAEGAVQEIDVRGIPSPLHVLRAHRALRAMQPGGELTVLTTSPQTIAEFQSLVKYVVGYELVSQEQIGDEVVHVLRRKR